MIIQTEANAIGALLATQRSLARILVTDDAVDSGVTLSTVLRHLRKISSFDADFRSAAITQTLEHPIVTPDYLMFHGTLCRFPWSFDAAD